MGATRAISGAAMAALCALLAAGPVHAQGGDPAPKVASVEVALPPGSSRSLLEGAPDLVALRRGQRLSVRAVRRSVERLMATGRFADVVVRARELDGGVAVVFELTPKRRIEAVRVEGNQVLKDDEVVAAAGIERDAEYWAERVQQAAERVTEAYRRKGYRQARTAAELEESASGLELVLRVEEGPATPIRAINVAGGPGLPLPHILEALGLGVGEVLDLTRLEAGLDVLRERLRQARYYRAKVFEPSFELGPEGATVALPVSAGPQYEVHLHGNRSFPREVLLGVLDYDGQETLDRGLTHRLAQRLANFYRYQGYHDVKVAPKETRAPDGSKAVLAFEVEEGRTLHVRELFFAGNTALSTAELKGVLAEVMRARTPLPVGDVHPNDDPLSLEGRTPGATRYEGVMADPARVLVDDAYREAAESMTDLYRERGFLSAQVTLDAATIHVAAQAAFVRFGVREGPQARLTAVEFQGLPAGESAVRLTDFAVGDAFSYPRVEQARLALVRQLGRRGYLFAKADAQTQVSASGTEARVLFRLEAGPQVRVGKVLVQGLVRTRERVVRSSIAVREGEVLDPEVLLDAQRSLIVLNIFRTVTVRLIAPDTVEPVKDVVVELKERPRASVELGGGYFLAEGPRFVADFVYPNAAGSAINVNGRVKVHYIAASTQVLSGQTDVSDLQGVEPFGGRVNLSAQNRGLLPWNIGWRADLLAERVFPRNDYRFSRVAGGPGLDWSTYVRVPFIDWARLKVGLSAQWEAEVDRVTLGPDGSTLQPQLGGAEEERRRFPVGTFILQTARFGPSLDLRDDPANPHRGALLLLSGERTWDIYTLNAQGGNPLIQTFKVSGTFTTYLPVTRRWVLALSGRAGRVFLLDPRSETIAPKRFYLGGASSMRGFREDGLVAEDRRRELQAEVASCQSLANTSGCSAAARRLIGLGEAPREVPSEGGLLYTLGKAELRFPAFGSVDLGLFAEAGNLWLSPDNYQPLALRYVAGAGLRYVTPIGPLALDVGSNLQPDPALNEPRFQLHFNIGLF